MNEVEKIANAVYFEGITSIRAVLRGVELGVNNRRIEHVYFDNAATKTKSRELSYLMKMSRQHSFSIEFSDRDFIDSLSVGTSHGGIIAKCSDRDFLTVLPSSIGNKRFFVMLEGIEDPFNFGYALRSLYAFGADAIILPERNWMSAAGIVCRSSAGASELCEIYSIDCLKAVEHFKSLGVSIIAAAKENSQPIRDIPLTLPIMLVIGGEKRGISQKILAQSDHIACIDYGRNFRSSLSAASAAAVLGYEISQRLNN